MLTFPPQYPRRRKRASRRAAPSPTPVAQIHVLFVAPAPGEPTVATWVFDGDIEDPTSSLAGLTIGGHPGISWQRDDTSALRVDHDTIIAPGQSWACAAGAGGIVGIDGQELAAGSGSVSNPPP
jgi:hypothetical protein